MHSVLAFACSLTGILVRCTHRTDLWCVTEAPPGPHSREALSSMFSPQQLRTGFPLLPWGGEQWWLSDGLTRGSPVNMVARKNSSGFICLFLFSVWRTYSHDIRFLLEILIFLFIFLFTVLKCSFCRTCFSESWEIMLSVLAQWTCLSRLLEGT